MARFEIPEGWSAQAFCFALDLSPAQAACLRRQFGGRRYARNWAVRTLKEDLDRYQESGEQIAAPSLAGLRKGWNQVKDAECTDAATGQVWWPQVSKEAFADGIKAAVDGYWNWQASRAGKRAGKGPGSPGSPRRAATATGTGSRSPPEPSGSNRADATSLSPGPAPSACTRTPAGCSAC
jgi:putative transposase